MTLYHTARIALFSAFTVITITLNVTSTTWDVQCPSRCECLRRLWSFPAEMRNATVVTCSDHTSVDNPLQFPNDTQVLILRNTSLASELPVLQLVQLKTLHCLDLSINKIRSIKPPSHGKRRLDLQDSAFTLPTLIQLNTSRNAIRAISTSAITSLFPALESLSMDRNIISTLCASPLGESLTLPPRLQHLILSRNRITTLMCDSAVLEGPQLTTLILSHNLISRLHNGSFSLAANLKLLDLSYNRLAVLEGGAFTGVTSLHRLDLSGNALKQIPSLPFTSFTSIGLLTFNQNPIRHISSGELKQVNVTYLEMCNMDVLRSIAENAFSDLPLLETVRLFNNRRLASIASGAFSNTPQLKLIDLRDNNLVAIENGLIFPQHNGLDYIMTEITLYISGNPLICDCNLKWIHDDLLNNPHFKVADSKSTRCYDWKTDAAIILDDIADLPNECEPFVLQLFESVERTTIAGDALFECRAIGFPKPHITWVLPGGEYLSDGECYNQACFRNESLTVSPVHSNDGGSYECRAENSQGEFRRSLHLQVDELHIQISPLTVTSNFVTLAWNGSILTTRAEFLLQYQPENQEVDRYREIIAVELGANAHSYTLGGLQPGQSYIISLCIQRDGYVMRLTTIKVTMREEGFLLKLGIRRSYTSGALISVLAGGIVFGCCCLYGIRVCRRFGRVGNIGNSRLALVHSFDMGATSESSSPLVSLHSNSVVSDVALLNFVNIEEDTDLVEEDDNG